ncbi:alkanesulfonates transport system permease protein (plasmid) [Sinorhizobium americanum]|uniref:Alkanesulfonates transport system permease protein n=1 Tax=Sinorhizobium americanum TaxID=194963 RepID=A0A1L3LTQ6_9HYPH|nr:alkanesulfonates transport system permease protein [Sinorhizobium americanum]
MSTRPLGRWMRRAGSLAICLIAWQMASALRLDLGVVTFQNVPGPVDVAAAALEFLRSPRLYDHVSSSIRRVLAGYVIAAIAGVVLGLVIGRSRWLGDILETPLELLRPIPAVAWIPLAVLMFPSSEASMIFITFTGALFPILINTVHGVENVDPRLVASALSLGSTRTAMLFEVIIPGAAPNIVTGLVIDRDR